MITIIVHIFNRHKYFTSLVDLTTVFDSNSEHVSMEFHFRKLKYLTSLARPLANKLIAFPS